MSQSRHLPPLSSPLVSVLMPVYQTKDFVERAIVSVLEQDYQHLELIIVDDCSCDGSYQRTQETLARYHGRRVLHHRHERNQGLAVARQTGIGLASGQYYLCLDSDDYLYSSDVVSMMVEEICRTGAEVVTSDYVASYRIRSTRFTFEHYRTGEELLRAIMQGATPSFLCNKMIAAPLLSERSFVAGQDYLEDMGAMLPLLARHRSIIVGHIPAPSIYYTQYNSQAITATMTQDKVESIHAISQRIYAELMQADSELDPQLVRQWQLSITWLLLDRAPYRLYPLILGYYPESHTAVDHLRIGRYNHLALRLQLSTIGRPLGYLMARLRHWARQSILNRG